MKTFAVVLGTLGWSFALGVVGAIVGGKVFADQAQQKVESELSGLGKLLGIK